MSEQAAKLRKRSVKLSGHSTSLSLEGIYWEALKEVAGAMGLSMNGLIERIDKERSGNLSSAVRVFLFRYYRDQAAQGRSVLQGGTAQSSKTAPGGAEQGGKAKKEGEYGSP